MTNTEIAELCHELNRAYCRLLGDDSQLPWAEAADWQQTSAIRGVDVALGGATPEEQHAAWCRDKVAEGWIYGPVKDPERKQHPCLVDYAQLPVNQRVKDALFIGVVRACRPRP